MSKKQYTYKEATPEQIKEWNDTELKWWVDNALKFVIYASYSVTAQYFLPKLYLIQLVT